MFKTLANALKVKDIRKRLFFTFLMIIIIRFGSLLPIPGINTEFFTELFTGDGFDFVNAVTGGSFLKMTVFALSITPYITASIIIQLLTIAIPKLEELQKDGEDGRKKLASITRYLTVILALIESAAMVVGFGNQGLILSNIQGSERVITYILMIVLLTAGSTAVMWVGERITEKGIGNGISIVLLVNIIARVPEDFTQLGNMFVKGKSVLDGTIAILIITVAVVGTVLLTVLLCGGERKIPVQNSSKLQGRKTVGGQSSSIPLKVNTAGVIPVIFAQSILAIPGIIASFTEPDYSTVGGKILMALSSNNWFKTTDMILTLGILVYIGLLFFFAYFYTSITFNPLEIAENMKKSGGFIPGIRPGKPTADYLTKILNRVIFIGAVGLMIVAVIPIVFSGLFNANVSFGGTSIIIIVGVVLETLRQIESMMVVRNYKGFLNE